MSAVVTKYTVKVNGETYSLLSDESAEHIARSAAMVDSIMKEIQAKAKFIDPKQLAVLAALKLSSALIAQKDDIEQQDERCYLLSEAIQEELQNSCDQESLL